VVLALVVLGGVALSVFARALGKALARRHVEELVVRLGTSDDQAALEAWLASERPWYLRLIGKALRHRHKRDA
jgi:hypothetical protein